MKDDLEQLLQSLHLRKIAEIFDEEAQRAETAGTSYQELVARLLRAQWQANQEAALAWRIKRAGAASRQPRAPRRSTGSI